MRDARVPSVRYCTAILLAVALFICRCGAAMERDMVPLSNHIPAWAHPTSYLARAPSTDHVRIVVDLGLKRLQSVAALARQVSDPASPHYRQYLTPKEFARQFSPSVAQANLLARWLTSAGLEVVHVAEDNKYVAAEGSVAAMEKAFSVQLNFYRGPRNLTLRAPAGAPSMPLSVVDALPRLSVLGLDQHAMTHKRKPKTAGAAAHNAGGGRKLLSNVDVSGTSGCEWPDASTASPPLYNGIDNNTGMPASCSYTAKQFRTAYGVPPQLLGRGQTIGFCLWNYSPFLQRDLDAASALAGIPTREINQIFPPFHFSRQETLHPSIPVHFYSSGAALEEAADLQIAHGMAPEANLVYIFADQPTDPNIITALRVLVTKRLASMVSNSFGSALYGPGGSIRQDRHTPIGDGLAQLAAYEDVFLQATCTGVGMYFATGDSGATSGDPKGLSPSWPAASPWVTAVGGTGMALGRGGEYLREFPWGHQFCKLYKNGKKTCDFTHGGGGGRVHVHRHPLLPGPR